ncbi:MAG: aminoacyl-histidine dipeptidase [Bacteroides sp. SM23_62_1]|nr:MAG: aminoacyl-histidine dipeptidase [Bacteroides sp. SM23_62_1]
MSQKITDLEPKAVWKIFYELTRIPRPSKKEGRAVQYVREFGERLALPTHVDTVGNVIIKKPATPGFEHLTGIVMQSHLDMVPQKNSDTSHDFEKDPIEAYVDGDWVKAKGTTLGSDNGIGVAAILAILESDALRHGPLEGLFTVDEETGMTGAFNLQPGLIDGKILINLDSEDEGELYIGCAGGMNTTGRLTFTREPVPSGVIAFKIGLTGLKGGHSGLDIHLGRGNSNKLLSRFMYDAGKRFRMRLAAIDGGSLRNAIPRESFAVVTIPENYKTDFLRSVQEYQDLFRSEFGAVEPDLKFIASSADMPGFLIDQIAQEKLFKAVYGIPNGVIRMSTEMPGIVETSANLAIVKSGDETIEMMCLLRSSVDSAKDDLGIAIQSVMELAGAEVVHDGSYPGWKPDVNSPILSTMKKVYQNISGKTPEVKVIHAGLECGIIGDVYKGLDMISFGPTIRFPHSPDEKVHIGSVGKFWKFLIETLKSI